MTAPTEVSVPLIDISGYLDGDSSAKKNVIDLVRDACERQGFLQIVGHRVSPDIRNRFMNVIQQFFALPISTKESISQDKSPCNRGYEKLGGQKLEQLESDATTDQKEGFSVRRDRPLGDFLQGPNQWPPEQLVPNFKNVYMEYFDAVHGLSKTMFRIIAVSLGLQEEYFDEFAADPDGTCLCRAHHYPPTPKDARTRGVGAHTDFGALTLLAQDNVEGLEVLHRPTGTWHPVPALPGAYVVNIGDLMRKLCPDRIPESWALSY